MTTSCQPIPKNIAEELLQLVARSICDRPGESSRQRESRTHQMVHTTLGFEPRDGLEYMLSTMVVGHFHLILDSMRDALQGQMDQVKAKTKTTIVSLDRAMLSFIREMRVVRRRPVARPAEETPAATPASDWIANWAGVAPAAAAPDQPASPAAPPAQTKPSPEPAPQPPRREPDPDDATTEQHIVAFEDALAALAESLREAHAADVAQPLAIAAGGEAAVRATG